MKGKLAAIKPITVALCVLVLFIVWLAGTRLFNLDNQPLVVTGTMQAKEIAVASKIGGRVAKIFVQEGQLVHKGQTLVEFEVPELQARHHELRAHIDQSSAELLELKRGPRAAEIERGRASATEAYHQWQMLKAGYRPEEVARARAQAQEAERGLALLKEGFRAEEVAQSKDLMEQTEANRDWIQKDLKRMESLAQQGAVSLREVEELRAKLVQAREGWEAAAAHYRKLKAGARPDEISAAGEKLKAARHLEQMMLRGPREEEIESARQRYLQSRATLTLLEQGTRAETILRAEATVRQGKAALSQLEAQLSDRIILAPAEAEVSVLELHAGEIIPPNKTVMTLTRLDTIWTRVYLPERQLSRVRVGQEVEVKVDAYPKRLFRGKIVQIPGVAEFTPRNVQTPEERSGQVFALKVNVANEDRLLRGGMNAEIVLPPVEGLWGKLAREAP